MEKIKQNFPGQKQSDANRIRIEHWQIIMNSNIVYSGFVVCKQSDILYYNKTDITLINRLIYKHMRVVMSSYSWWL